MAGRSPPATASQAQLYSSAAVRELRDLTGIARVWYGSNRVGPSNSEALESANIKLGHVASDSWARGGRAEEIGQPFGINHISLARFVPLASRALVRITSRVPSRMLKTGRQYTPYSLSPRACTRLGEPVE